MTYVRLAESAAHAGFSFVCDSVVEAMALAHYYVWHGSNLRCADVVCTDIRFPWPCDINYTRNGSFNEETLTDRSFEYLYGVPLN